MIRERMRIDRFRTWIGMAVLLLAFAVSPAVRGDERHAADKIAFYMANGFEAGRFRA